MKFSKIFFVEFFLIVLLISGCNWFIDRSNFKDSYSVYQSDNQFNITILWKSSVNSGISKLYFKSYLNPVIKEKYVYLADYDGVIKALDLDNGKEIWSTDLSITSSGFLLSKKRLAQLKGGVGISKNYVYVGSDLAKVYALNVHNGIVAWEASVAGEALSTPLVSNGLLLIHTSNGMLQAINETDGTIKWTINLETPKFNLRGESSPAVSLNTIIVGGDNGLVSAINIDHGELIWQKRIAVLNGSKELDWIHDIQATPVIIDETVYVSAYNGNLVALDLKSGNIIWFREIGSINNLLLNGTHIYIIDQNDHIMSIDRHNGTVLWQQSKLINCHLTTPVLYNGFIVTGDIDGYLHWINPNDGSFIAHQKIDRNGFKSSPIVAGSRLIVQAQNGDVYAITSN